MKQLLILWMLVFSITTVTASIKPKHRSQQNTTVTADTIQKTGNKSGIEVFSDTSNISSNQAQVESDEDFHDPLSHGIFSELSKCVNENGSISKFGILMMFIFLIICVIAPLLLPVFITVIIIRYLKKKDQYKIDLIKKSMDENKSIPNELLYSHLNRNNLMMKGFKNIAIGIGLIVIFALMDFGSLIGIGIMFTIYGVGQIYIEKNKDKDKDRM